MIIEIIGLVCGAGGILGAVSYVLFFKETKRIKGAEAKKTELENWEKQIDRYEKRLQERDAKVDALYLELRKEQEARLTLVDQVNIKELDNKILVLKKCETRGCANRQPPGDF